MDTTKRGIRGWKVAQRQSEFADISNFCIKQLINSGLILTPRIGSTTLLNLKYHLIKQQKLLIFSVASSTGFQMNSFLKLQLWIDQLLILKF
jgi:hypothetical protein